MFIRLRRDVMRTRQRCEQALWEQLNTYLHVTVLTVAGHVALYLSAAKITLQQRYSLLMGCT